MNIFAIGYTYIMVSLVSSATRHVSCRVWVCINLTDLLTNHKWEEESSLLRRQQTQRLSSCWLIEEELEDLSDLPYSPHNGHSIDVVHGL